MDMDDETRELLRQLRDQLDADTAPADIVPPTGLTLEALRIQSDAADTWADVFIPGQPIEDTDGRIVGMTPGRTERVYRGGTVISDRQMRALGLTPEDLARDYPGIDVVTIPNRKDQP